MDREIFERTGSVWGLTEANLLLEVVIVKYNRIETAGQRCNDDVITSPQICYLKI